MSSQMIQKIVSMESATLATNRLFRNKNLFPKTFFHCPHLGFLPTIQINEEFMIKSLESKGLLASVCQSVLQFLKQRTCTLYKHS